MACVDELHLGDIGTSLEFEVTECIDGVESVVNITNATILTVRLRKPDIDEDTPGAIEEKTGSIYTGGDFGDGRDGIIQYVTIANDIDEVGIWKAQAKVGFADGSIFSSNIVTITVKDNL